MKLSKAERRYRQAINDFWAAVKIGSIHLAYAEYEKAREMIRTNPTEPWAKNCDMGQENDPFRVLHELAKTQYNLTGSPRCHGSKPEERSHLTCDVCGVRYRSGNPAPICIGYDASKVISV